MSIHKFLFQSYKAVDMSKDRHDIASKCVKCLANDICPTIHRFHEAMYSQFHKRLGQDRLFQDTLEACIKSEAYKRTVLDQLEGKEAIRSYDKHVSLICTSYLSKLMEVHTRGKEESTKITSLPFIDCESLIESLFLQTSRYVYLDPRESLRQQSKYYRICLDAIEQAFLSKCMDWEKYVTKEEVVVEEAEEVEAVIAPTPEPEEQLLDTLHIHLKETQPEFMPFEEQDEPTQEQEEEAPASHQQYPVANVNPMLATLPIINWPWKGVNGSVKKSKRSRK